MAATSSAASNSSRWRSARKRKGRFILSIDDVPEIREVFAGFRTEGVALLYSVSGGNGDFLPPSTTYDADANTLIHTYNGGEQVVTKLDELQLKPPLLHEIPRTPTAVSVEQTLSKAFGPR